jgi:hypothetical protein
MNKRGADGERDVVLLEAGDRDLSLDEIAARSEERVRQLVAQACRWRPNGHGRGWRPGDYNILIFETTVGVDAELYVQFWSEPKEPVEWEVSSGRANPRARPFVGEAAQAALGSFGFAIGGGAQNFRKQVTIANMGDVHAVARETLRLFVEALGYRGRTPLVARISINSRAEPRWVYRSVTPEDLQKMFWHAGRRAVKAEGLDIPVLNVEHDGQKYGAVLYGRAGGENLYERVDLRVFLGRARRSDLPRLNGVTGAFRGVKAYLDEDREAWLVQCLSFEGGATEDSFRAWVEHFERVLRDPGVAQFAKSLEREAREEKREAREGKTKQDGAMVH